MIRFREINLDDAEFLSIFVSQLDSQSEYLLFEPGERKNSIQTTQSYLSKIASNEKSAVFIAENTKAEIVGFVCGEVIQLKRVAHTMKVNIGVLKACRGSGVGKTLGGMILEHAEEVGIERIEATVIKENTISLNLFQKLGFEIEGIKKCSIKIADNFHDKYLLAKLYISNKS